jgi:predicted nucleic acid-binding protein
VRPSNREQTELATKTVNGMIAKGIRAVIPDICMGELVKVSAKKRLELDFEEVSKCIAEEKIVVGHVKLEDLRHYSSLVAKVSGVDSYLESTDVRILAMSIADRDCKGLLTFEGKLLGNPALLTFIAREVNFKRGHLITDDPFRR